MMLAALIVLPFVGGVLAWLAGRRSADAARWISVVALAMGLVLLWCIRAQAGEGPWLAETHWRWIPQLGIQFRLNLDGLSLPLIALTFGLGLAAIIGSWREIRERAGLFHLNLLWTLAGVVGVFLAFDLFLFFFFWELMLVPMSLIIALWGHERRIYAAIKFFIFTQGSGLLMLVAILALVWAHWRSSGTLTFDYLALLDSGPDPRLAYWIMSGFLIAFAVKLPAVPFHTWLPDAHTEAPTAGSVILAGVLLKTGAYGLMRFAVPLFPEAAQAVAMPVMLFGAVSIIYGAVLAFAQHDLKRLVAYSSVSHMGFVLLAVFAWNTVALQGAVIQMVAHGISTGALFIIVGLLQERIHTRDMRRIGGLAAQVPRFAALALVFAVATLGLPGFGNFVGEFLVLLGSFGVNRTLTVFAALGLITAAVYALILIQRTFHGPERIGRPLADLSLREGALLVVLMLAIVWLGVYPQPLIDTAAVGLANLGTGPLP